MKKVVCVRVPSSVRVRALHHGFDWLLFASPHWSSRRCARARPPQRQRSRAARRGAESRSSLHQSPLYSRLLFYLIDHSLCLRQNPDRIRARRDVNAVLGKSPLLVLYVHKPAFILNVAARRRPAPVWISPDREQCPPPPPGQEPPWPAGFRGSGVQGGGSPAVPRRAAACLRVCAAATRGRSAVTRIALCRRRHARCKAWIYGGVIDVFPVVIVAVWLSSLQNERKIIQLALSDHGEMCLSVKVTITGLRLGGCMAVDQTVDC